MKPSFVKDAQSTPSEQASSIYKAGVSYSITKSSESTFIFLMFFIFGSVGSYSDHSGLMSV